MHKNNGLAIILLLIVGTSAPSSSYASDYTLIPRIAISEEYNDNVNSEPYGKDEEFITRAQPGFLFTYLAPRLNAGVNYNFDYRHYANGNKGDEYTHNLDARGTLTIVDNFVYFEVSDSYKRVSLDVARDNTNESLYQGQSDQNTGRVSPYILWRYRENSSIKAGYSYTNTWYRESNGVDKSEHGAFLDVTHELFPRFAFTGGYAYLNADTSLDTYERHNAYGGFRYEYADRSFFFGQLGNTWQIYDNGAGVDNLFWNAGLTHDLTYVVAVLETRVQYTEDPLRSSIKETLYSGRLTRTMDRGSLEASVGYSEFELVDSGELDRRRLAGSLAGKYQFGERMMLSLKGTAERYSAGVSTDYPYRYSGNAGLLFDFSSNLVLKLDYSHISNRYAFDDSSGSNDTNRVVLELAKTF